MTVELQALGPRRLLQAPCLERMHKKGWGVEVLAWERTCNPRLKEWANKIGVFVPLENFYDAITFTEDDSGALRRAKPLDLSKRKMT